MSDRTPEAQAYHEKLYIEDYEPRIHDDPQSLLYAWAYGNARYNCGYVGVEYRYTAAVMGAIDGYGDRLTLDT